jgi:hypothetical protein
VPLRTIPAQKSRNLLTDPIARQQIGKRCSHNLGPGIAKYPFRIRVPINNSPMGINGDRRVISSIHVFGYRPLLWMHACNPRDEICESVGFSLRQTTFLSQ